MDKLVQRSVIIFLLLATACAGQRTNTSPSYPIPQTISAPTTVDSSFSPRTSDNNPALGDAESYAQSMGVTVEEAMRRFRIQDTAGILQADLIANEPETFAGLWIEHTPNFRIVILFTQDPNKTIQRYLTKDYMTQELREALEVRNAKVSLAELENAQQEISVQLGNLEMNAQSEINVYENNITLVIQETDKPRFDDGVQRGLIQLPEYVKVVVVPEPQFGPARVSSLGDHFPQLVNMPNVHMDALFQGELALVNGCLRVNSPEGDSVLLIWHPGFSTRTEGEVIHVIDQTGQVVAGMGDFVKVGGGFTENPNRLDLAAPLPEECPGPYWMVGANITKADRPR